MNEAKDNPLSAASDTPLASDTNVQRLTSQCRACGGAIMFEDVGGIAERWGLRPTLCNACADKRDAAHKQEELNLRIQQWRTICPPLYQETDLGHPSMPSESQVRRILDWTYQPRGLLIHGPARCCKTRLSWLLVRRLMMEGHTVSTLNSSAFAARLVRSYRSENPNAPFDFLEELTNVDVLFLDDLGKCKLTDRVEQELFDVFEHRCAHKQPTILTTNHSGETLLATLSADRGLPLILRLREFCEDVAL